VPTTHPGPAAAVPGGGRPLRRDAEANRLRILAAAGRVFAARGLDVTLDDIAAAADVGIGTIYRRFPDKQELIDALFGQRIDDVAALARAAATVPDPWEGLVRFIREALKLQIADKGLAELMAGGGAGHERVLHARLQLLPLVAHLVEAAQAAGELRSDVTAPDIALMSTMLSTVAAQTAEVGVDLWERYLTVVLDGLRTRRRQPTAMTQPPLTDDQFDRFFNHRAT
jgi:AcrR family transcriptional regulator